MKKPQEKRWSLFLLILLIAADLVFCAIEVLYSMGYADNYRYSIAADRGYAEVYGYIKFFWIIIGLSWLTYKKYQPIYIVGTFLFFYFLVDDLIKVHETVGEEIVEWFNLSPAFGLRAKDFGEMSVLAVIGLFFLGAGWLSYKYSNRFARLVGLNLLIGIFALAFFGVGVDIFHKMVDPAYTKINTALMILEDGGELVVVSVICWFVYSLAKEEFPLSYNHPDFLKE